MKYNWNSICDLLIYGETLLLVSCWCWSMNWSQSGHANGTELTKHVANYNPAGVQHNCWNGTHCLQHSSTGLCWSGALKLFNGCCSDPHFCLCLVIDWLKSQKTNCSNLPQDPSPIKIQFWWSIVLAFLRCCGQACYYFTAKLKPLFNTKE